MLKPMASSTDGERRTRGVRPHERRWSPPLIPRRYRSDSLAQGSSPCLPASIHPYPDAEVSGGILAELWLERRPAVRS